MDQKVNSDMHGEVKNIVDTVDVLRNESNVSPEHVNDTETNTKISTIYIKDFANGIDEKTLKELLDKCGASAKIMNTDCGKAKEFGLLIFEKQQDAKRAVDEMNGMDIYLAQAKNKEKRQTEYRKKSEHLQLEYKPRYNDINLYVKNLSYEIDDHRLKKEFSPFGTITSAKVMREGGRSKGFGFVCFSSPAGARKAIAAMNGKILASKPLYVAWAQRKDERQASLAEQYMQRMPNACIPNAKINPNQALLSKCSVTPSPAVQNNSAFLAKKTAQFRQRCYKNAQGTGPHPFHYKPRANPQVSPRPLKLIPTKTAVNVVQGIISATSRNKYAAGDWNTKIHSEKQTQAAMQHPAIYVQGQEPLTISFLVSASPHEQKQMLEKRLFPLIQVIQKKMAEEITGMLLEFDTSEIIYMLESPELLSTMVNKAVTALQGLQVEEAAENALNGMTNY
ncbi:hypothetical protein XELAEV_18031658mg [Xenopus laevis]|nr:hypothetical protein XELAEV_18031658mg [Xenopus laevis]